MSNKFEELHVFKTVVETMSFTRAAEKINTAKSSISRRVSDLEARLGVQLLHRTTRKLSLTTQGQHFYEHISKLLSDLYEAEQLISNESLSLSGHINIAAPLSFGLNHLTSVIAEFAKQYPNIELNFDLNDREIDLIDDGFDLALRIGHLADSTLIAKKLAPIRFTTCASPDYIKRNGLPTNPQDLSAHYGLFYTHTSNQQMWQFNLNGQDKTYLPIKKISSNNGIYLAQLAVQGLGIIRCPNFIIYQHLQNKSLIPVLKSYKTPETGLFALFPPGRLMPSRVRVLVDFLAQQYGNKPYWDDF